MPINYISNWEKYLFDDIIDVRSPSEFLNDHMPNAINLPVLSDKQRNTIGTIYKKKNAFDAKKIGAALISKNISVHLRKKLISKPGNWKPLIYCWRGGQRSKAMATVLSEIGWKVTLLKGGYKTYRGRITKKILSLSKGKNFVVIKGPTGCAKTKILKRLNKIGYYTLDLEGLAKHKGSLLGKIPNTIQPSQKLFESKIYFELIKFKNKKLIFIESESSKVGNLYLPSIILKKIKNSPAIEINADMDARVNFLINDYKNYIQHKDSFLDLFLHAKKKVGKEVVEKWQYNYERKNWKKLAFLLITEYYDLLYSHNLKNKNNKIIKSYHLKKLSSNSILNLCDKIKLDFNIY